MSNPMTLRDLLGAGTARPWQHEQTLTGLGEIHCDIIRCGEQRVILAHDSEGGDADFREADAALICAAVNGAEALLDEVERLKEFIAASEACAAGGVIGAVHDENRRLRAAFQKALDDLKETGSLSFSLSGCEWCHSLWPKLDGQTQEETEQFARRHAYACTSHPMRAELDALRAAKDTALRDLEAVRVGTATTEAALTVLHENFEATIIDRDLLRALLRKACGIAGEAMSYVEDMGETVEDWTVRLAAIAKEGKL